VEVSLKDWGWDAEREREAAALLSGGWRIGRVVGQGRGLYALTDGRSVRLASVSGAFGYRAVLPSDYPVTGDFVACREEQDTWVIEQVLPRRGTLSRKAAGKKEEEQVLAANIDAAFLVFAVDGGRGFVRRLLERLLTLVRESGAAPVILLNKADLAEDRRLFHDEAEAAAPGVPTLFTSALTGEGLDRLRALLEPARTFYFLGKSGVGKSSLINALFGEEVMKTAGIREKDKRGRHTTTRRELFQLPNGALLVDSPGLREAALWAEEASVDDAFPDVASLAGKCRFRDCGHSSEPGCAVREALASGELDPRRYESYLDFKREARYHRLAADGNAQRLERLRWKKIAKQVKGLYKDRQKFS
jgi:ribosome biogenesis GTPase